MANGRISAADREAMLRRVAIVLSSLPAPVASQLLGSIDPESKKAVRRTMTSLTDVDALERKRAIQAFKVSVQQQPQAKPASTRTSTRSADTIQDEVVIGSSARQERPGVSKLVPSSSVGHVTENEKPERPPQRSGIHGTSQDPAPLSFLADVDDDTLVNLMASEHPQAIALVLASIAPSQAARVLPRLDPRMQVDALSRVGRLGDIPPATVAEVADHFRKRVARQASEEQNSTGKRALDAILAAMPSSSLATPAMTHAESSPGKGQHQATAHRSMAHQPLPQQNAEPPVAPLTFPSSDAPAVDLTHKLRVAEETRTDDSPHDDQIEREHKELANDVPVQTNTQAEPPATAPMPMSDEAVEALASPSEAAVHLDSTDSIHQHLTSMAPEELCQVLGKVETRVAMLTLCGLPPDTAESVLAVLPKAQSKKVRIKMASLGSLHLREIDEAKEIVARASLKGDDAVHQVRMAA